MYVWFGWIYVLSESVSESDKSSFKGKQVGETAVFLGGEGEALEVGDVGGSSVKELGVLGNKGGVAFACCDDEEATGEVGALAVTVVAGIFPTRALDLRQGATMGDKIARSDVQ